MKRESGVANRKIGTTASISLALLTVSNSVLYVAASHAPEAKLVSISPDPGQQLDQIARIQLNALTSPSLGYMEQLYTFSFDNTDGDGIVVSYLALAAGAPRLRGDARWIPVSEAEHALLHGDRIVLDYALVRLRAKIGYTTIAFHLMPESFTLSDIQQTYETILARPLDPRNFRRRMVSSGLLQSENQLRRQGSHRPAALYRFAGNHDPASFLTPGSQDESTTATRGLA